MSTNNTQDKVAAFYLGRNEGMRNTSPDIPVSDDVRSSLTNEELRDKYGPSYLSGKKVGDTLRKKTSFPPTSVTQGGKKRKGGKKSKKTRRHRKMRR
jgi:hypothetical protein